MMWNTDLDALEFRPSGHDGVCLIHRLAFKALLAEAPDPDGCLRFYATNRESFEVAARDKITSRGLPRDSRFHLTSRDVRRALSGSAEPPQEVAGQPAK